MFVCNERIIHLIPVCSHNATTKAGIINTINTFACNSNTPGTCWKSFIEMLILLYKICCHYLFKWMKTHDNQVPSVQCHNRSLYNHSWDCDLIHIVAFGVFVLILPLMEVQRSVWGWDGARVYLQTLQVRHLENRMGFQLTQEFFSHKNHALGGLGQQNPAVLEKFKFQCQE